MGLRNQRKKEPQKEGEAKEKNLGGVGKGIGSFKPSGARPHAGWPNNRKRPLSWRERKLHGRREEYDKMINRLIGKAPEGSLTKPGSFKG